MTTMNALFFSKFKKSSRGLIALSFLLISVLGNHWLGYEHAISHSGITHHTVELSCDKQDAAAEHSSASCHLLDALTLAGFLPAESFHFYQGSVFSAVSPVANHPIAARFPLGLYQSQAPPTFNL
ncbi:hypothetical protein [Polynucleobacter antarcticus]